MDGSEIRHPSFYHSSSIIVKPGEGEYLVNLNIWIFFSSSKFILNPYHRKKQVSTVKPVLHGHSEIDKTKVLKTNGSLMKIKSIAECSLGAFCNTFDLH